MRNLINKEIVKRNTFECIKRNVLRGRTIIEFNLDNAIATAQEKSSYYYPVLVREKISRGKFNDQKAYAIPV